LNRSDLNPYQAAYKSALWSAERDKLTAKFDFLLRHAQLPPPVNEYRFHPTRGWRFDRAWPPIKVAVEIEGGIWMKNGRGAHTAKSNFLRDLEKYNAAALLGWRVIRLCDQHLNTPYAVECVTEALRAA
jgi:hypothetical protein